MGRIVAVTHLTLDGVMQAPGGLDEDTRDDFRYGGVVPAIWRRGYGEQLRAGDEV
jgi:hypothetical protein